MRPFDALPGRRTLVPASCLVLAAVGVAAALGGPDAAAGLVVGSVLVVAFFLSGRVPLRLGPAVPAGASFLLLGLGYVLRIGLLLVALWALRDAGWLDRRVVGGAVVAGALLWNAAQLSTHLRSRRSGVEPVPSTMPRSLAEDGERSEVGR